MIGKVVIGKTFGGCISYVVQKKDAQLLYGTGIRTENIRTMTDDFNMQRKIRPSLGKAVGHISLNWSLHDKARLTPEMMLATAQDYLLKMNIRDTQVLIVQHKDTAHPTCISFTTGSTIRARPFQTSTSIKRIYRYAGN
ncbi:hypothetical protein HDF26_001616 [Pedobacter cryoconitis]|nr:relaxase/mobilization nuclease domain-containing protein [Pedobacter cryoconitis]MBB6271189.1 hypothetical protein [Pedobacter cryoconitis]